MANGIGITINPKFLSDYVMEQAVAALTLELSTVFS